MFKGIYRGKNVLLTGHTGFKGSWLALWLKDLGAELAGIGLDPETAPSHWDLLDLSIADRRLDLRDLEAVLGALDEVRPDIIFHLAAQPLVHHSFQDPQATWSTNVLGTANLLEACRRTPAVRAIVVVSSDKCYENQEWPWSYRETDPLGGHDPYSASKAAVELLAASYRRSFFSPQGAPLLATARAGNVIGGGDWSRNRLVPDLVRAISSGQDLVVRSPEAVRPWQHVFEPLSGYLLLGQGLLEGREQWAQAWNFGPDPIQEQTVADILLKLQAYWPDCTWRQVFSSLHETHLLRLDYSKARQQLGWQPVWSIEECLAATADWYRAWIEEGRVLSRRQLSTYARRAGEKGAVWAEEEH